MKILHPELQHLFPISFNTLPLVSMPKSRGSLAARNVDCPRQFSWGVPCRLHEADTLTVILPEHHRISASPVRRNTKMPVVFLLLPFSRLHLMTDPDTPLPRVPGPSGPLTRERLYHLLATGHMLCQPWCRRWSSPSNSTSIVPPRSWASASP